ncbi:hypothetical protein CR513_21046, partial [Mucuna pruriens]
MISVEIGEPSPQIVLFEPGQNEEELRANLDITAQLQAARLSTKKNNPEDRRQQADPYLGRAFQSSRGSRQGGLSFRTLRRLEGTTLLECVYPEDVL